MKELSTIEISRVAGGEIIPGSPSAAMLSLNAKLMVAAGRGLPGFDVSVAALVLAKYASEDFWNPDAALEYARNGDIPV